jgi:heparin/heparan-sulfate lyase
MTNIRHFYGSSAPKLAEAAHAVQKQAEGTTRGDLPYYWWFIQPFCQAGLEESPAPMDLTVLPPARHFEGTGQTFMRSGRGADATYALFAAGGTQSQHRHYDLLHFTIYKHGFQAMDTGTRWSQFANGRHLANYFGQTVAHNCVLIHMSGENPAAYWGMPPGERMTAANYGGQDNKRKSTLEAYETNEVFTYVAGDAGKCYTPRKSKLVTRQMVFIMPDVFVIFDRVNSTKPEYRKDWLLHTASEPTIDERLISAIGGKGKLLCRSLLPEKVDIRVVGGPGNEFRTGDRNWDIETVDGQRRLSEEDLEMIGQWRVEISPHEPATDDLFLNVIQVGRRSLESMVDTELLTGEDSVGVRFAYRDRNFEVTFAKSGKLAGHIRADGDKSIDRPLTEKVFPQKGILQR